MHFTRDRLLMARKGSGLSETRVLAELGHSDRLPSSCAMRISSSLHLSTDGSGTSDAAWSDIITYMTTVVTEGAPLLEGVNLAVDPTRELQVELERVKGTGAMGSVVEGVYQGNRVAVKLMHPAVVADLTRYQQELQTFTQEVQVLGRIRHPNVVTFMGACLTPPRILLIEELCECNLADAIHGRSQAQGSITPHELPLERILAITRDIAMGLAYLHPTIMHRDLKPANILLTSTGVAKISDFGLSRVKVLTQHLTNYTAGTAHYMAPECFDANNLLSEKLDIYSLGTIMWEMVTRTKPWRGLAPVVIAVKQAYHHERLPLPPKDDPRCPPRLRRLIVKCWSQVPSQRPSAAEILKQVTLMLDELALQSGRACASVPWHVTRNQGPASARSMQLRSTSTSDGSVSTAVPVSSASPVSPAALRASSMPVRGERGSRVQRPPRSAGANQQVLDAEDVGLQRVQMAADAAATSVKVGAPQIMVRPLPTNARQQQPASGMLAEAEAKPLQPSGSRLLAQQLAYRCALTTEQLAALPGQQQQQQQGQARVIRPGSCPVPDVDPSSGAATRSCMSPPQHSTAARPSSTPAAPAALPWQSSSSHAAPGAAGTMPAGAPHTDGLRESCGSGASACSGSEGDDDETGTGALPAAAVPTWSFWLWPWYTSGVQHKA